MQLFTNSINNGEGFSNLDLNLGWACVAIKNGWFGNSIYLTNFLSGESPEKTRLISCKILQLYLKNAHLCLNPIERRQ